MSCGRALWLRFVTVALLILAAVWGSWWAYVGYQAHRARLMLAEASRVRVCDTEASVLSLVQRYGGFKRTTEPLPPREEWLDKNEYDYQQTRQSNYKYEIEISPFGTKRLRWTRFTRILRTVRAAVPERLRPVLGMRDWETVADFSIRGGRVQSVSAMTLFAGRSEWLGDRWELAEGMPQHDMPPRTYAIGEAFLTMGDGGGAMIENVFTPKASEEQAQAARQFNTGCLTSIKGCSGLCDVAPRALEYLEKHPDADWNITPSKCP